MRLVCFQDDECLVGQVEIKRSYGCVSMLRGFVSFVIREVLTCRVMQKGVVRNAEETSYFA